MTTSFSQHFRFIVLLLFCTCFLWGCSGGKVSVGGKVTFPDGAPLTVGAVIFESDGYQVFGNIDSNGTYTLGETTPGSGIKPGEYKVRVMVTTGGGSDGAPLVHLIDPKFAAVATSKLTCTVKGKTVYDIPVEKP
jgi:hypothetical protein